MDYHQITFKVTEEQVPEIASALDGYRLCSTCRWLAQEAGTITDGLLTIDREEERYHTHQQSSKDAPSFSLDLLTEWLEMQRPPTINGDPVEITAENITVGCTTVSYDTVSRIFHRMEEIRGEKDEANE